MPLGTRWARILKLMVLVCIILLSSVALYNLPNRVQAAAGQTVPLYLHRLPANITVAGALTSRVLNTTTLWGGPFTSPNLRYTIFNFTLYPELALDLQSTGSGSIRLWVTVSGAPGTLNATVYDVSAAGQVAVVTTSIGVANSTSPTTPYAVAIPFSMNHVFSQSSTIKLALTAARVGQLYLWYDSGAYPAAIILPTSNVPSIPSIGLRNYALNQSTRFSLNWTDTQRIVLVIVHVDDPFGAYSIANATVTILGPGSSQVYTGVASPFTTPPGAPEKLFALNWAYPQTAQPGNYTVSALAYDTAGNQALGSQVLTLYSTTSQQPPGQQPPETLPLFLFALIGSGLALGLAALLLVFLFFRRRAKCPKCGARVSQKLSQCPKCGSPLEPSSQASSPA